MILTPIYLERHRCWERIEFDGMSRGSIAGASQSKYLSLQISIAGQYLCLLRLGINLKSFGSIRKEILSKPTAKLRPDASDETLSEDPGQKTRHFCHSSWHNHHYGHTAIPGNAIFEQTWLENDPSAQKWMIILKSDCEHPV